VQWSQTQSQMHHRTKLYENGQTVVKIWQFFKTAAVCHVGSVGHILGSPKSTWRNLSLGKIWMEV